MATFPDGDAFARELERLQRTLVRENREATRRMAEVAQTIAVNEASRDLGGDDRFSGWNGPRLGDLRIRRVGDGHLVSPSRSSAGAWTVAERGRNQGNSRGFAGPGVNRRTGLTSRTKAGNVRKVRSVTGRRWNGYTSGKGTATRAVREAEKAAEKIADKAMRTSVARHFD